MFPRWILLVFVLTVVSVQVKSQDPVKNHTKGYCVWYDQCTPGPKAMNCFYNGPAKNLNHSQGLKILNDICPELKGQPACCSTKQLVTLSQNLQTIHQMTSRCPACWNNIRRLYCQFTCSQDQSLYMDVDSSWIIANYILQVNYYVSPEFKQGLFDSCKDVWFPGMFNEKALYFLCGTPVEKCTPEKLLSYMGSTDNGYAPFNIHYPQKLAPNLSWMNETIFKCNESFIDPQTGRTANPCSCWHCTPSCSVGSWLVHSKRYCVWYDLCQTGSRALNCFYNGPAKNMTDPLGVKILNNICPELKGQHTCCSTKQLETLSWNLQAVQALTSCCPACWNNIRRLYCLLTCSRDQSLYMDMDRTWVMNYIQEIYYYVSPDFKQGLFDSCKDINSKALDLLCGTSTEKCTPQKLLTHMGSTENGFAPFNISYPQQLASNLFWMNETIFKCSEPFIDPQTNKTVSPFSCQNCTSSCPVQPLPPSQPTHRKIIGLDVLSVSLLVVFVIFLLILFPLTVICWMRKRRGKHAACELDNTQLVCSTDSLPQLEESPPQQFIGIKFKSALHDQFTKSRVWCSTHPYIVMGVCAIIIGIVACWLFIFRSSVSRGHVESSSGSSESESCKEKEIFVSKFIPFYRIEQLIIRSTNPEPAGYNRSGDEKWVPFGPIFDLDLLNQALELQNDITNMMVPYGTSGSITLEDICFQTPQAKQCVIQSVFQYFQNNQTILNKCLTLMGYECSNYTLSFDFFSADFHDHLLFCTSSPTSPDKKFEEPCLGAYGEPVDPNTVLDGFDGTAYENATTVIITFLVNNHKDKSKLTKALAWEKAFTEYMTNYVKDPQNGKLTVSFSTERDKV